MSDTEKNKIQRSDSEWKEILSEDEYRVLRKKGTEPPHVNEYNSLYDEGMYLCRACGNPLFSSESKYNSKSGWPSFYEPVSRDAVTEQQDNSHFMQRTEVLCSRCESHLGHVFSDGPEPTGERYCMNSLSLKFVPKED